MTARRGNRVTREAVFSHVPNTREATSGTRSCVKSETYIVVVTRAPSRALSERVFYRAVVPGAISGEQNVSSSPDAFALARVTSSSSDVLQAELGPLLGGFRVHAGGLLGIVRGGRDARGELDVWKVGRGPLG